MSMVVSASTQPMVLFKNDVLCVTKNRHEQVRVNDIATFLTEAEIRILHFLYEAEGMVRTVSMIMRMLYGTKRSVDPKIIDVFICKIRKKLKRAHPQAEHVIRSVWGRGYAWGNPAKKPVLKENGCLPDNKRWVVSRKVAVIECMHQGEVLQSDVLNHYPDLSVEELTEWRRLYDDHGQDGLRTTQFQSYT